MTMVFDNEEPMTPEAILLRFKKVMGRTMSPEEMYEFFLLPEHPAVVAERLNLNDES